MRQLLAVIMLIALVSVFVNPVFAMPRTDLGPKDAADAALHSLVGAALFLFAICAVCWLDSTLPEETLSRPTALSLRELTILIC